MRPEAQPRFGLPRPQLLVSCGLFVLLLLLVVSLPVPRNDARQVAAYLCRSPAVTSMLRASDTASQKVRNYYATGAATAIIAMESYNRPALWRVAEEVLFTVANWASPRVARMTLGPAQISRAFFEREISPLAPGANYPASIATVPSAWRLIAIWASARIAQDVPAQLSGSPVAYRLALAEIFDKFHGYDDPTYRAVGLSIAADRCHGTDITQLRHRPGES